MSVFPWTIRMERGSGVLKPAMLSEENWLQQASLSPSTDCFKLPVKHQYGEILEISHFSLKTVNLYINCCLWSALRALDRRRERNAKHYIINSSAWACASVHALHFRWKPTWKQHASDNQMMLRRQNYARREEKGIIASRWRSLEGYGGKQTRCEHEDTNIWLPSHSSGWQSVRQLHHGKG